MDDGFKELTLAVGITVIIFIIVAAFFLTLPHDNSLMELNQLCKSRGGVLLDQTYQSGKATNHNYTCIQANTLIDLNEKVDKE